MKKYLFTFLCLTLLILPISQVGAYTIDHNSSSITYGSSWDNPSLSIEDILGNQSDTATLTLVNGIANETETWSGDSVYTILIEEIAGYAPRTTFGWYEVGNSSAVHQIFSGADGPGATAGTSFTSGTNFGFYINPNGVSNNTMYTEHGLNSHDDYQVTIWQVNNSPYNYILGWEDLDLYGGTGGDRDYQDMIVSLQITPTANPVPEPGTMILFGLGLFGLAGVGRKKLVTKDF